LIFVVYDFATIRVELKIYNKTYTYNQ